MLITPGLSQPLRQPVAPSCSAASAEAPQAPTDSLAFSHLELGRNAAGMKLNTRTDYLKDGHLVGQGGQTFEATTALEDVPALTPDNGKEARETVVWVNGIMTDVDLQTADMQSAANAGFRVVGIHNATKGLFRDLAQCVGDKLELKIANNQAVNTAAGVIEKHLEKGKPLHLVGHSQGGLVISNALGQVRRGLLAKGLSESEADEKLAQVNVTSLGGASYTYPKGPRYAHYVNGLDMVPMAAGMGLASIVTAWPQDKIFRFTKVGRPENLPALGNGVSNFFARVVDRTIHGAPNIYMPEFEVDSRGSA